MSWPYTLDDQTSGLVELLAKEDELTAEEFLKKLVTIEDGKRHIDHEPFVGKVRIKCYKSNCAEKRERLSIDYEL